MRFVLFLALFALAASASAQFVPASESEGFQYWGLHLDSGAGLVVFDRLTQIEYDERGAAVLFMDTPLPTLIGSLVYLAVSGDTEARDRTRDTFVPLLPDVWGGRTFVATPVGEVGLGLDAGGAGMTTREGATTLDLVVYAGPNVLFTARPVENLHLVGHAAYQFMYSLGDQGTANGWGNRFLELDVQATWPLSNSFAIYGGVNRRDWTFPVSQADGAPDASFSTFSVTGGVKLSSKYLFFL